MKLTSNQRHVINRLLYEKVQDKINDELKPLREARDKASNQLAKCKEQRLVNQLNKELCRKHGILNKKYNVDKVLLRIELADNSEAIALLKAEGIEL